MLSKYGSRKQTVSGITFDSRREARRFQELRLLEQAGQISGLRLQVKYVLIPTQRAPSFEVYKRGPNKGRRKPGEVLEKECAYIADFVYTKGDETVVEDAKGVRTKEYIIKRKLMLERYGIRIKEV
nr:MAG TPA: Endonuclease [Caudoviricetes sp.]